MSVYMIDRVSETELIANILGRKPNDPVCFALAGAMTTDGCMSGDALGQVAREHGGIGPRGLARLESAVELGRRTLVARAARRGAVISTPEQVAEIVRPLLVGKDREYFVALALTTKNGLIKLIEISVGSLSASVVHPRELFREAVSLSAASLVISHQHPSNDCTPSGADIQLTRRLVKAGDVLGIEVLDHVIIGGDQFASLRELGLM